jgi:hypothetical protein
LQASDCPNIARKNWIDHVENQQNYEVLSALQPKKKEKNNPSSIVRNPCLFSSPTCPRVQFTKKNNPGLSQLSNFPKHL